MNKGVLQKRQKEKAKYVELGVFMPSYGGSNHGADALGCIISAKPNFVVDLGCGHNNFIKDLKRKGIEGVGVDFISQQADIIAPMHELPLADGSADFITAFDSLEHLIPEDVDLVFEEMSRIAMPKANFCFSIAYSPSNILVHGQNLHPTIQPEAWWVKKIPSVGDVKKAGKYLMGTFK